MLLIILLIAHFLADFTLQSSNMAENKINDIKVLLAHSGIYALLFIVVDFLFISPKFAIWTTIIIAGSHLGIDWLRAKFDKTCTNHKTLFFTFIIDQALHIASIVGTYFLFVLSRNENALYNSFENLGNFNNVVLHCFLFVALLDPAAILIKKFFAFVFKEDAVNNASNNAGSTIGKLERIITAILLLCGQYGVIGLVLTAKSIARFKQLEDQSFAEKYLIGTLISLLIVLAATLGVKYLLSL